MWAKSIKESHFSPLKETLFLAISVVPFRGRAGIGNAGRPLFAHSLGRPVVEASQPVEGGKGRRRRRPPHPRPRRRRRRRWPGQTLLKGTRPPLRYPRSLSVLALPPGPGMASIAFSFAPALMDGMKERAEKKSFQLVKTLISHSTSRRRGRPTRGYPSPSGGFISSPWAAPSPPPATSSSANSPRRVLWKGVSVLILAGVGVPPHVEGRREEKPHFAPSPFWLAGSHVCVLVDVGDDDG